MDADLDVDMFLRQVETFRRERRMQPECRMIRYDGTPFPVSVTMQRLHDGEREIIAGFSRDITEETQAREEARRHLSELARVSCQSAIGNRQSARWLHP